MPLALSLQPPSSMRRQPLFTVLRTAKDRAVISRQRPALRIDGVDHPAAAVGGYGGHREVGGHATDVDPRWVEGRAGKGGTGLDSCRPPSSPAGENFTSFGPRPTAVIRFGLARGAGL